MTYPKSCPTCGVAYAPGGLEGAGHTTLSSAPGGTPSPWRPELPGRILTLKCGTCRETFDWDFFAQPGPGVPRGANRRDARA